MQATQRIFKAVLFHTKKVMITFSEALERYMNRRPGTDYRSDPFRTHSETARSDSHELPRADLVVARSEGLTSELDESLGPLKAASFFADLWAWELFKGLQ